MKNNWKTMMGAVIVTTMVLSCPVAAKSKGKIKSIAVTNLPAKTLTLKKGKSKTLKFKVTASGKISKALAYKTSNKKIVTVSKKGKVTAKKKGKAKITAYTKASKSKKVVITVTVGTPVTKVSLNKKKATIYEKKTLKIKASVSPKSASNKKVLWKTSNKKIATVSSAGKVTAKKKGSVTITATAADGSGKKATSKITVKAAKKPKKVPNKNTKKPQETVYNLVNLSVSDPYHVTFALNKAQKLNVSQVTIQAKTTEETNYRKVLKIKSLTTSDQIHYTIRLQSTDAIGNDVYDHNVRVFVSGLKNNPGNSVLETLFRKGKINKTIEKTAFYKKGRRIDSIEASTNSDANWTYEVTGIPAGMAQNSHVDGVYLYGTPTDPKDQDVVVKETDPYGNVYTTTTHLKFYDSDTLKAYADDCYISYDLDDINTHNTATVADDTLNLEKSVSAYIQYEGGQPYHEEDVTKTEKKRAHNEETDDYLDVIDQDQTKVTVEKLVLDDKGEETRMTKEYKLSDVAGLKASGAFVEVFNADSDDELNEGMLLKSSTHLKSDRSNLVDADGHYVYEYKVKKDTAKRSYRVTYDPVVATTQFTDHEVQDVHYDVDHKAFSVDSNGYLHGKISQSTTVNVTVSRKKTNGQVISVQVPVHFYLEKPKLVKGQVTAANNKAVPNAEINFNDTDQNTNYSSGSYRYESNAVDKDDRADYYGTTYEAILRADTTYDVLVAQSQSTSYYAKQTPQDTMNYMIDGNLLTVAHNGKDTVNADYYDTATNDYYYVVQDGKDSYEVLVENNHLTLTYDGDLKTYTINVANGTATATVVTKK